MTQWAKKPFFAMGILVALVVIFVLTMFASNRWTNAPRVDLTEDGLYTLSTGTQAIVSDLHEPIDLTLYFSRHATQGMPQLRRYAARVKRILGELAASSQGKVKVHIVDPTVYSSQENSAYAAGLTALPFGYNGERVFFGLVGSNHKGKLLSIPFFDPNDEAHLEYSLAKIIYILDMKKKKRVDVISGLPLNGDKKQHERAWAIMRQLKQLFDIHVLDAKEVTRINSQTKALLLIQPEHLSTQALHAIDQYVMTGGRLAVFVDPDAETTSSRLNRASKKQQHASFSLAPLFQAWGIEFNPDEIVLDRSRALSIAMDDQALSVLHPAIMGLTKKDMNQYSSITRHLNRVNVSTSGFFELAKHSDLQLVPLLQTTGDAMPVPADLMRSGLLPSQLAAHYQPTGEHYALAALVKGTFHTAFPDSYELDGTEKTAKPNTMILVADTDILSDRLWIEPVSFMGQKVLDAFANNANFVTHIVDDLTGSSALINVRSGVVSQRPFVTVERLRNQAGRKFRQKRQQLRKMLANTEAQDKTADKAYGRYNADKYLMQQLQIRKQLDLIKHQLDQKIDRLGQWVKFINILLIPLVIMIVGSFYGLIRIRRMHHRHRPDKD